MNKQEIFDTVARGILSQGGPSVILGRCRYRDTKGRKCAAGWLIPDNRYITRMDSEGSVCGNSYVKEVFLDLNIDLNIVNILQMIHDNSAVGSNSDKEFMIKWKQKMIEFAGKENLKVDTLNV